ncbi:MAG: acetylglutamate kinase [Bacillota bacterium]
MAAIDISQVLIEALPYIQRFSGKTIVIKYGGNAMTDPGLASAVAQDVVLMRCVGMNPVLVHGGGPQVSAWMRLAGLEARFVDGLRVTDEPTLEVAEMVLAGKINKELVRILNEHGGSAVGLSGQDGRLLVARQLTHPPGLGLVGEVTAVNTSLIQELTRAGHIPVIATIAAGAGVPGYNVNADTAAGAVASALGAEKVIFLTDVAGIVRDGKVLGQLEAAQVLELVQQGVISGGMMPKVEACLSALQAGVPRAHIIDGRVPHSLLLELFTDRGIGTMLLP